jgi:hypothetical protein
VLYVFVRGRELEGTFPGDSRIGVWPITELRIMRGWGVPPEKARPFNLAADWPPVEPPGIDALAKLERIGRCQRVLTLSECKTSIAQGCSVSVTLEISDKWTNASQGRIPTPLPTDVQLGSHCVALVGYDDGTGEFHFANSALRRNSTGPAF